MSINGFINVLKPPGMTSHDVVSYMRRIYKTKKIGHAGTLDPAAAGVLPIAIGYATRLLEYITDVDKSYRAEVLLGLSTDTDDYTGKVLKRENFSMPLEIDIKNILAEFCGEIAQVPPIYSAIKIDGHKAYDLARKSIAVDIPPRMIRIHDISLLQCRNDSFRIDVHCSKGTYIRTLCADIGKKLQIPAVMGFLIRTAVGSFELANASTLEEIAENPLAALHNANTILSQVDSYEINEQDTADFRQGKKILYTGTQKDETAILIQSNNTIAGIGKVSENGKYIAPHKVFIEK